VLVVEVVVVVVVDVVVVEGVPPRVGRKPRLSPRPACCRYTFSTCRTMSSSVPSMITNT
jgi:hypothetical protein